MSQTKLNHEQFEAATYTDGHILVLAGAGTGKTTMLLQRFIYLIDNNFCLPDQVLITTFTTKAAEDMKKRLTEKGIVPEWIGTFHSLCGRIVRNHAEKLGLNKSFKMIDGDEQKYLMHKLFALQATEIDEQIQYWKNQLMTCDDVRPLEKFSREYKLYQKTLQEENQLDFSDLIIQCCKLWEFHPEIVEQYRSQFKYICVDEFQDTNHAQMHWLKILLGINDDIKKPTLNPIKLFCVGDDDQMIYSWRNANVAYILDFGLIFHGAKIIKLRQNYRSTQSILRGALDIVSKNIKRHHKVLLSNAQFDEPITMKSFLDDNKEAKWIAKEIMIIALSNAKNKQIYTKLHGKNEISIGILLRTVWQVNSIRKALSEYQLLDKTLQKLLWYLNFIINLDYKYLTKILLESKRGIGDKTLEKFEQKMQEHIDGQNQTLFQEQSDNTIEIMKTILLTVARTQSQQDSLTAFFNEIQELFLLKNNMRELMKKMCKDLNIHDDISKMLVSTADEANTPSEMLQKIFIPVISILTIHSAKGLEYDIVFLPGWEERIFPHVKAIIGGDVEEERRLAYVAITRARFKVHITYAMLRQSPKGMMKQNQSRFLNDISDDIVEMF